MLCDYNALLDGIEIQETQPAVGDFRFAFIGATNTDTIMTTLLFVTAEMLIDVGKLRLTIMPYADRTSSACQQILVRMSIDSRSGGEQYKMV